MWGRKVMEEPATIKQKKVLLRIYMDKANKYSKLAQDLGDEITNEKQS